MSGPLRHRGRGGGPGQDAGQRGAERSGLGLGQDQRRGQPDGVRLHRVDQEPGLAAGGLDVGRGRAGPASGRATGRDPRTPVSSGWSTALIPSRSCWPMAAARASSPSASMVSSTASAAAQATGLPPNVLPWSPGLQRGRAPAQADAGADGQPAAEALGQGDHVRGDAVAAGARTSGRCGRCRSGSRPAPAARRPRRRPPGRPAGSRAAAGPRRPRPGRARGTPLRCRPGPRPAAPPRRRYGTNRTGQPNGPNGSRIDALPVSASAPRTGRGSRPRRRR